MRNFEVSCKQGKIEASVTFGRNGSTRSPYDSFELEGYVAFFNVITVTSGGIPTLPG